MLRSAARLMTMPPFASRPFLPAQLSSVAERFHDDKQGLHTEIDLLTSDIEEGSSEGGGGSEADGPGLWLPEEALREHEMPDVEGSQGEEDGAVVVVGDGMEEDQQPAAAAETRASKSKGSRTAAGSKRTAAASSASKRQPRQQNGSNSEMVGKTKQPKAKRTKK